MNLRKSAQVLFTAAVLTVFATGASANEASDELMAALKACKADKKTMDAAQAMVKKHKGKPTDDQVDDFIDTLDDKMIDCVDAKLD